MKKVLDIIFVGGGPSALFCASILGNSKNFLIFEKGKTLEERKKSIDIGSSQAKSDIVFGVGGAGLFSDGKLNFSTDIGGNPLDVLSQERINKISKNFFKKYSITPLKVGGNNIKIENGKCLVFPQFHFGSDRLKLFITNLIKHFQNKIITNSTIKSIIKEGDTFEVATNNGDYFRTKKVIIATGQSNIDFSTNVAKSFRIKIIPKKVSIGFRVEASMKNLKRYFEIQYDPKILIETSQGQARTFCSNPGGYIVSEEKLGFSTANGYANYLNKSDYGNFAILLKVHGKNKIIEGCKKLSKDTKSRLIVENISDFIQKIRTKKLYVMPQHNNYVVGFKFADYFSPGVGDGLREALNSLIKVEPGLIKSIFYAPELKVLPDKICVKKNSFESVDVPGLFFLGDSSGNIHGLWNAIMSGTSCAEELKNEN